MDISQILIQKYGNRLTIEEGATLRLHEWAMVEWVLKNMASNVVVKRVCDIEGVKTADLLIDNRLFEMKQTSGTLGTLDTQVRYAVHQSKGQGVIINIIGDKYVNNEAIMTIINRMHRAGLREAYILRELRLVGHVIQSQEEFIVKKTTHCVPMRGAQQVVL